MRWIVDWLNRFGNAGAIANARAAAGRPAAEAATVARLACCVPEVSAQAIAAPTAAAAA